MISKFTKLNTAGSGNLRAAVLGVNDGLVSNLSLVMGVAGGINDRDIILIAGVAGLLAGSLSMAAGEYISMRSQRDVYEHQIEQIRSDIVLNPQDQQRKLESIYAEKGLSPEESVALSTRIMANPDVVLDTFIKEDLGLSVSTLGSPWGASMSSFIAFVVGAVVPIVPYLFDVNGTAIFMSAALSLIALFAVGGILARTVQKNIIWGGLRMVSAGGFAATVTFGIGTVIGVSILS